MFSSFRMKLNCHWLVEREPHCSSDCTTLPLSLRPGYSSAWNIIADQSHL